MKKLVALLMVLALLTSFALAEPLEVGATLEKPDYFTLSIDSVAAYDKWQGAESDTHAWIAVGVTLVNFSTLEMDAGELSATLTYAGKYEYPTAAQFAGQSLEPLVRYEGTLVFRVPKMVAEADLADIAVSINIGGEGHPLALSYKPVLASRAGRNLFFETPEEAIEAFAAYIQAADFEGALACMDARVSAENYDLAAMIERMNSYQPNGMDVPSEYAAYVPLNEIQARSTQGRTIFGFMSSLLIDPEFYDGTVRKLEDDGTLPIAEDASLTPNELIARLDPARLSALELTGIYLYDGQSAYANSEAMRQNTQRHGAVYGYSEAQDYAATYAFEGREYAHTYTVALYPDGWKITRLNSNILRMPVFGTAQMIDSSEADFSDFIRVK